MDREINHEARGLRARLNILRHRAGAAPALVVVALATSLALLPTATGAAPSTALLPTYVAAVAPTAVSASSTTTFTASINNVSLLGLVAVLQSARITVPAGFTNLSIGMPSSGTASLSGQDIMWSASLLNLGGSVSIPVTATAPSTPGFYTFVTSASTVLGAEANASVDPAVQVNGPNGVIVACTPSNTAATGTNPCQAPPACTIGDCRTSLSGGATNGLRAVADQSNTNDLLALDINGGGSVACGANTITDVFNVSDTARSKTVYVTVPSNTPNICWIASAPFTDKNRHVGLAGDLANCIQNTDAGPIITAPPCIDSTTFGYFSVSYVIKVPAGAGDPSGGRH
jgi:hypothetical protein